MAPLVSIAVPDPWDQVRAGEVSLLRVVIARPADQAGEVVVPSGGVRHPAATVTSELLTQDVTLRPGDEMTLTLGVRFEATGADDLSRFEVQVNPVGDPARNRLAALPTRPFQVVPALDRELAASVTRICAYEGAVKSELTVRHVGVNVLRDVEWVVGPSDCVRAGLTRRRAGVVRPGDVFTQEVVAAADAIELTATAAVAGDRVQGSFRLPIPEAADKADGPRPFAFLEPRMMTTDRVQIITEDGEREVTPRGGLYPVRGGKSRYRVTIHPSHPHAQSVQLHDAPGEVEVEPRPGAGRAWSFMVTVVDNPLFTGRVRLDYTVQVPGLPLQGELHLSVRPSSWKLWGVAITGGMALTVKGVSAVVPAVLSGEASLGSILTDGWLLLETRWWDVVQLCSIPVIRAFLWVLDQAWRPLQEV